MSGLRPEVGREGEQMSKHLWEYKHHYYCNEGCYYERAQHTEYETFAEFLEENGNIDLDYNLLFRWDWEKEDGDRLLLFWVAQRKARNFSMSVRVTEADEPAVRAFLQRAADHLFALWAPIVGGEGR
jgi:hypothetical protein